MKSKDQILLETAYLSIIEEGIFDDAKRVWGASSDPKIVNNYIDVYKNLKNKQQLKGQEADISPWLKRPFEQFKSFINQKQTVSKQKEDVKFSTKDATKVFENDTVLVLIPNTWEASKKYGANTKWCTASKETDEHFEEYTKEENIALYYILPKNGLSKVAVSVYPDGKTEVFNELDKQISLGPILKQYNIPKEIFKNEFSWNNWLKKYKHEIHKDGSVSVFGDVNLESKKLVRIPLNFKTVTGDFLCSFNELTSLEGCPSTVGGNFNCHFNRLKNLKGGPVKVGGNYNCGLNYFTSYPKNPEGTPTFVGGKFSVGSERVD